MSKYIVLADDIVAISTLGFKIDLSSQITAEVFVNVNFRNFNIFLFARQLDSILQPIAEDVIRKGIQLKDEIPPKLIFSYITENIGDADHHLLFKRTFIREVDTLLVKHDFLVLPLAARGKRIGRKILQICLQDYLEIGVAKIKIHAALEDGGYEWTKAGFRATEADEMHRILLSAEQTLKLSQYNLVKKLYDDYYGRNPTGRDFPIMEWSGLPFMKEVLRRHDWHGEIDLTNALDLFNFSEYVNG